MFLPPPVPPPLRTPRRKNRTHFPCNPLQPPATRRNLLIAFLAKRTHSAPRHLCPLPHPPYPTLFPLIDSHLRHFYTARLAKSAAVVFARSEPACILS